MKIEMDIFLCLKLLFAKRLEKVVLTADAWMYEIFRGYMNWKTKGREKGGKEKRAHRFLFECYARGKLQKYQDIC